jgi:hypothetical protein
MVLEFGASLNILTDAVLTRLMEVQTLLDHFTRRHNVKIWHGCGRRIEISWAFVSN